MLALPPSTSRIRLGGGSVCTVKNDEYIINLEGWLFLLYWRRMCITMLLRIIKRKRLKVLLSKSLTVLI